MANIIGPKKSEKWERANMDNPDIPKKWLQNHFYKHGRYDAQGKRIRIKEITPESQSAYEEGWEKIFGKKSS